MTARSVSFLRVFAIAVVALGMTPFQGCGGGKPTRLDAQFAATADANSGSGSQASADAARPVVVRVYELNSAGAFMSADFFSLYNREAETLGPSLLAREEVSLVPGQRERVTKSLSPEASYLGVVAAFHDIDQARWRDLAELRPGKKNKLSVSVAADSVGIVEN